MIRKCTALLLSTALVAAAPAWAQEKITRLVVAFPAGGPVDFVARTIAEQLGKELNQRVIIEITPARACILAQFKDILVERRHSHPA